MLVSLRNCILNRDPLAKDPVCMFEFGHFRPLHELWLVWTYRAWDFHMFLESLRARQWLVDVNLIYRFAIRRKVLLRLPPNLLDVIKLLSLCRRHQSLLLNFMRAPIEMYFLIRHVIVAFRSSWFPYDYCREVWIRGLVFAYHSVEITLRFFVTTIYIRQFVFDTNIIRQGSLQLTPLLVVEGASNILLNHLILHNLFDLILHHRLSLVRWYQMKSQVFHRTGLVQLFQLQDVLIANDVLLCALRSAKLRCSDETLVPCALCWLWLVGGHLFLRCTWAPTADFI